MAARHGNGVTATRQERAIQELAASRRELVGAVTRQVAFSVEQMGMTPADAGARARERLASDPDGRDAGQVAWFELANLVEHDTERGEAAWQRLKDEAALELATGFRASRSLERPVSGRPYERAQFAAVLTGLRTALDPRDGLEELLIQQLACAYDLQLRWQALAVQRMEEGVWQGERDRRRALETMGPAQRERYQSDSGWLPPRIAETEALDQAVLTADRYQRSFLRLMKAYRDQRRLVGSLVVAGGQVNIGERQVNIGQGPAPRPARVRSGPVRRVAAARVRKAGGPA